MKLLLTAALLFSGADEGWVTWRVEAGEDTGYWCCSTWSAGKATSTSCQLDGDGPNISHDDPTFQSTGEMQIFAKLADGKAVRIRALSPQCPVEAEKEIKDLGLLTTDESLAWLIDQVGDDRDVDILGGELLEGHKLGQTDRVLVGGPPGRGRRAP